jgi:hypothetical protein
MQPFARARLVCCLSLLAVTSSVTAVQAANTQPPTVSFLTPADQAALSGSVQIQVEACSVPGSDTIVGMQLRFSPAGEPTTSWRNLTFVEAAGCVSGTYDWDSGEFSDGAIVIDARAADRQGNRTKWSQGNDSITVTIDNGGSSGGPLGERFMFVWDTGVIASTTAASTMLDFAESKNVSILYLDAAGLGPTGPPGAGGPADFDSLITDAHSRGLQVYALLGWSWWGVPCGENLPGQDGCMDDGISYWQDVMAYQDNPSYADFDGFIDDTEPYTADIDDWWNRIEIRAQMLLDYHNAVRGVIGTTAHYVATIPFWYDNDPRLACLRLDGKKGGCQPLAWYLSEHWSYADETAIMAYRDFAVHPQDPDHGITPFTQYEVDTFKTTIIVETIDLDAAGVCEVYLDGDCILDFSAEGEAAMEAELTAVHAAHSGTGNLVGFCIHYYEPYAALAP